MGEDLEQRIEATYADGHEISFRCGWVERAIPQIQDAGHYQDAGRRGGSGRRIGPVSPTELWTARNYPLRDEKGVRREI